MDLKFNDEGCLPQRIYELTLDEVENGFVQENSQRRQEIFEHYKIHLKDIEETGCCLNHWIDGSFVTLKENPGDIDTLTEFDGVKVAKLGIHDKIEDIMYNAPLRTNGCCHSFFVYKVPNHLEMIMNTILIQNLNICICYFQKLGVLIILKVLLN